MQHQLAARNGGASCVRAVGGESECICARFDEIARTTDRVGDCQVIRPIESQRSVVNDGSAAQSSCCTTCADLQRTVKHIRAASVAGCTRQCRSATAQLENRPGTGDVAAQRDRIAAVEQQHAIVGDAAVIQASCCSAIAYLQHTFGCSQIIGLALRDASASCVCDRVGQCCGTRVCVFSSERHFTGYLQCRNAVACSGNRGCNRPCSIHRSCNGGGCVIETQTARTPIDCMVGASACIRRCHHIATRLLQLDKHHFGMTAVIHLRLECGRVRGGVIDHVVDAYIHLHGTEGRTAIHGS